jgi:hypothetical protein
MPVRLPLAAAFLALCAASPALAGAGTAVPEPSSLVLFGLGVAGVIIGRQGGRRPRD